MQASNRVTKRNGRVSSNLSLKTLTAIFFRFLVIDSGARATEEEETSGVSVIPPMNQNFIYTATPATELCAISSSSPRACLFPDRTFDL
ncbi:hypothetical protein CDAR_402941 [Caerostris darwini]|uniref:Uncharacterized protein n=1 Tax=Caerostris darwini TaxID=1538125 RepID=A0AAV4X1G3_9ARAC|nr:hypothetical protein CDAR_402941 [Caerostris darwini]